MKKVELLSPAGDFDCLVAAVQNGADSVYFGGSLFNARASASNFDEDGLKKAISYAKLRNVKTHFTLNTLVKDSEFEDAVKLGLLVYNLGIDALIVQDLGLARFFIQNFPDLPIHASTQMSIHNLEGALSAEHLGFKRVVLSRELSLDEIRHIASNSNIEIETFIHGALCVSYSGQCLFSSMIGGRSGNRGRCAQPCRMYYDLLKSCTSSKQEKLDCGYLLSTRDLCGLDFIPDLIQVGVSCFKIEGRMKTPDYVATVTRIYRKYIDLALSNPDNYKVDEADRKELMQVFNRGGFSEGHLNSSSNRNLVFKEKPNHMGLLLGNIEKYNANKGILTLTLKESVSIGDTLMVEKEESKYTVSELMLKGSNIKSGKIGHTVQIGRLKGHISVGDKVFKVASKALTQEAKQTYDGKELKKIPLDCILTIKKDIPIYMQIKTISEPSSFYHNIDFVTTSDTYPIDAINSPLTIERVINQISKTNDTPYEFKSIKVCLDDGLFLPNIKSLNELRRKALANLQDIVLRRYQKNVSYEDLVETFAPLEQASHTSKAKIVLLLNLLDINKDYSKLKDVNKLYIPLKYFADKKYTELLSFLTNHFSTYIYMPTIVKANYHNLLDNNIETALEKYPIKGFIVSNIACGMMIDEFKGKYEYISNYTLNVFNKHSISELKKMDLQTVTLSPELNKQDLKELCKESPLPTELICYGRTPIMNMNYCVLGVTNKCYPTCGCRCTIPDSKYYLKDYLGYQFRIIPDNIQTVTTIYNSKITSISNEEVGADYLRIDILDEDVNEINHIIDCVQNNKRLEGKDYTNGNFNRNV